MIFSALLITSAPCSKEHAKEVPSPAGWRAARVRMAAWGDASSSSSKGRRRAGSWPSEAPRRCDSRAKHFGQRRADLRLADPSQADRQRLTQVLQQQIPGLAGAQTSQGYERGRGVVAVGALSPPEQSRHCLVNSPAPGDFAQAGKSRKKLRDFWHLLRGRVGCLTPVSRSPRKGDPVQDVQTLVTF